jgi:hypothetical protein
MERLQGWHPDPTGRHQERYFSQGAPTHLYRDGSSEGYDDRDDFPSGVGNPNNMATTQDRQAADVYTPANPPWGWYPDPLSGDRLRVWDGVQWSEETRPRPTQVADAGSGSIDPTQELRAEPNGASPTSPQFCLHCGAPLSEGSGTGDRGAGGSGPSDAVPPTSREPRAPQVESSQSPATATIGWDRANGVHNGLRAVGSEGGAHATELKRRWGDDKIRVAANGANGAPVAPSEHPTTTQTPAVPNLVPSPGWYPVRGSPELLRWWDGSEWGVVRHADASVADPQNAPWQTHQ